MLRGARVMVLNSIVLAAAVLVLVGPVRADEPSNNTPRPVREASVAAPGSPAAASPGCSAPTSVRTSEEALALHAPTSAARPITACDAIPLSPMWSGGFDTGDLSQWDGSFEGAPGRFSVVTATGAVKPREGSHMARVEVRPGDHPPWGDTGVETSTVYRSSNIAGHYDVLGDDRYTGFSVYIPKGFPYVPNQLFNYIFEWHGDNNAQAPFKIGINSIISRANPSVGFGAELNFGNIAAPSQKRWRLGELRTGQWVDFVVRVRWGHAPTGIVEVWMNGVKKVSAAGLQTWYTSEQSNVKAALGYYRPAYSRVAVLYLDAVRTGTSYRSVAPRAR